MPVQRASAAEQIANELRAEIEAGDLKAGDTLPSDMELARRFDVSKPTVTKARAMLVALRLVDSRAGAASVIRDTSRDAITPGSRIQRARRTGRIYPDGHYARILRAALEPAPPDVAAALGIPNGASAITRHRVTYAPDGTPLAKSVTYFAAELADTCPALLESSRIEQGTTLYVEQQTGQVPASIACSVSCHTGGSGPGSHADELRLPANTFLLNVATTTYDPDGQAIAYELELHPPDTSIALDLSHV